jgi:hypothetical protein
MREIDFLTLARFHPQMALAIDDGVPARPNVRPLSCDFSSSQPTEQVIPQSFSEIFGTFGVFTEASVTIDPTGAFVANPSASTPVLATPLKAISDACQSLVTGITVTLVVKGGGATDYAILPDDTPLQSVPPALASAAYIWAMHPPDNVKCFFTLAGQAPGAPFTAWLIFTFLQLSSMGDDYFRIKRADAIATLQKRGILPPPAAAG